MFNFCLVYLHGNGLGVKLYCSQPLDGVREKFCLHFYTAVIQSTCYVQYVLCLVTQHLISVYLIYKHLVSNFQEHNVNVFALFKPETNDYQSLKYILIELETFPLINCDSPNELQTEMSNDGSITIHLKRYSTH